MWMTELPPFVLFFIGALIAAVTSGRLRGVVMLAIPIVSAVNLWMMPEGIHLQFSFMDYQLSPYKIDKLSLMFAYVFHIAAVISITYSLHVKDTVQQVAGMLSTLTINSLYQRILLDKHTILTEELGGAVIDLEPPVASLHDEGAEEPEEQAEAPEADEDDEEDVFKFGGGMDRDSDLSAQLMSPRRHGPRIAPKLTSLSVSATTSSS